MITYIEGVDGTGKSTLVQKLVDKYGAIKIELPGRSYDEWGQWCDTNCSFRKWPKAFIADRSLISELVYRMEDKKSTFLTKELLQKFLIGTQFIYCKSESSMTDALTRGDDNIKNYEQHMNRTNIYEGVFHILKNVYKIPVITYNWRNKRMNEVIKFIEQGVNRNAV